MSENEPPQCAKCGEEYLLEDGMEPTRYCHNCAHEVADHAESRVAELEAVSSAKTKMVETLEAENNAAHRILDGCFESVAPDDGCAKCREHSVAFRLARLDEHREAENKIFRSDISGLESAVNGLIAEKASLEAENKRLRECADAMAKAIGNSNSFPDSAYAAYETYIAAFPREEAGENPARCLPLEG